MKSSVEFDFVERIEIPDRATFSTVDLAIRTFEGRLVGLTVEVDHDGGDSPHVIVAAAREIARGLITVFGVGWGREPTLGLTRIRTNVGQSGDTSTIGLAEIQSRASMVRQLLGMPRLDLVERFHADARLRRQAEALNAARSAPDVISRIRWAFFVLEQEKKREQGYVPRPEHRHLRNAVSHPEHDEHLRQYLHDQLGVDQLDLHDPAHVEWLVSKTPGLLAEAAKIVESAFEGSVFWFR